MATIERRVENLERTHGDDELMVYRWPDEPFVTVVLPLERKGERILLEDYEEQYPDAEQLNLNWGDED